MHISPAPFRLSAGHKVGSNVSNDQQAQTLPDAAQGDVLFHAAFMHVQARYPFMQVCLLRSCMSIVLT